MRPHRRRQEKLFFVLLSVLVLLSLWQLFCHRGALHRCVRYPDARDTNDEFRWKTLTENPGSMSDGRVYEFSQHGRGFTEQGSHVSSVAFRLVLLPHVEAATVSCSETENDCGEHITFVKHLVQKRTTSKRARLHIVPVDPLAWMKRSNADNYDSIFRSSVNVVNKSRPYITFKGSDYLFVCLMDFCQSFAEELARTLSGNLGTRAIYAGVDVDIEHIRWPCPRRVISVDRTELQNMGKVTQSIIRQATQLIEKEKRWDCADDLHSAHFFGEHTRSKSVGGVYMKEYQFLMCQIPKSGSTMLMMLLRRMMDREDWKSTKDGLPHNPGKSGVTYLSHTRDFALAKRVYDDPAIVKAVIVRHPITRLLSAYLDKIVALKEYGRVGYLPEYVDKHGLPSFAEFVDFLIEHHPDPSKLEQHFLLQSKNCGLRDHRFDFIGTLENLSTEFKEFSQSLGFWEDYISSGWGDDERQAFGVRSYQSDQRHAQSNIWQHYTEDLMMKVYRYYKEDFDRFGFSIDEVLETKPTAKINTTVQRFY